EHPFRPRSLLRTVIEPDLLHLDQRPHRPPSPNTDKDGDPLRNGHGPGKEKRADFGTVRAIPPSPFSPGHLLYQFQVHHRRTVATARSNFDDPGVTSLSFGITGSDLIKQLLHRIHLVMYRLLPVLFGVRAVLTHKSGRLPTGMEVAALGQRDHL